MTMTATVMTTKTTMGEMAGIHTLIGRRPPKIHRSETTLPRPYRALLSQLRSGHSVHPQSYFHWIGKATSPLCPLSDYFDDSVSHLFGCPAFRMSLIPDDFWRRPVLVAEFLSTHPSFSSLPPLLPPPPPPFPLDSPLFSPLSLPSSFSSSSSPTSSNSSSPLRAFAESIRRSHPPSRKPMIINTTKTTTMTKTITTDRKTGSTSRGFKIRPFASSLGATRQMPLTTFKTSAKCSRWVST